MVRNRLSLHQHLSSLFEQELTANAMGLYYQEPSDTAMIYPCIMYELSDIKNKHADDTKYTENLEFTLTVIDRNPDSTVVDKIKALPRTKFIRAYRSNGLNHTRFTIHI